ncbi:hypothetical protein BKA70DRAFT_1236755 [Coprinopsis sp. MPI-PUGE-AT-0042]|nr:hypothetical protein BKA70DRAFT_1236755 [Coprinopsis sp. MPI-PUGE-AT-0042]
MTNAVSTIPGQHDTYPAIVVDNFAGSLGDARDDTTVADRFSGIKISHGVWREPVANMKPVSSSEHRSSCSVTYEEETSLYTKEEIIRRKNLIITHQRRKIKQLEERILEMNRLYLADQMQALTADVDSMHIDP